MMIGSLLLAVALAQSPAPVLPPGVSPAFQAKVLQVEAQLQKGAFAEAAAALGSMPDGKVTVAWDDSVVPEPSKAQFRAALDIAFANWKRHAPNLQFEAASVGDLRIAFSPSNPPRSGAAEPAGMLLEGNTATISLQRGNPSKPLTEIDLHNEIARAIGVYLGVIESPIAGSAMRVSDALSPARLGVMPQDAQAAVANLAALEALRSAAAEKRSVTPASSSMAISGLSHDLGKMFQGESKSFTLQIDNKGTAPLELWMKPQCGCTTLSARQSIAPGGSLQVPVKFDSTEFSTPVVKHIDIVSNDPTEPTRLVELKADVRPMFRMLMPAGNVAVLDESGGKLEAFLTFTEMEPFAIRRVDFNGISGEVEYEPWQGTMSDPEMGVGEIPRKGYKFTIKLSPSLPPGRSPGTLVLVTADPRKPVVMHTVYAQKGIIALPDELYLGVMSAPKTYKLLVTRPGKDFKVLGVTSKSPHLKPEIKPGKNAQEYVLEVAYDGKAASGEFQSSMLVQTDDPKQPNIEVPAFGTVR